jgi:pyrophosphatase PpaX
MRKASLKYKLIAGTKDVLDYFRKKGAIQAIITSAPRHQVDHDLSRFGLHEFLELVISKEDVDNHKPAPDSILKALTSLKVRAEESLYVGDSYVDLAAGRKARVRTIGVLTGFCDRATLENGDPDMIIDSVADLRKVVEVIST